MKEVRPYRKWTLFMIQVGLVMTLFVVGLYMGIYLRDENLIEEQILSTARGHVQDILVTRMWNAAHGGVYVEKAPGVESNPYLKEPVIKTTDGRTLVKRNPAMMTREISELADIHGIFHYRITSDKPLNPNNAPDEYESQALREFTKGVTEIWSETTDNGKTFFRYIAPLETTEECMQCHAHQGYKIGDVRGGVSVTLDITEVKAALKLNQIIILGLILVSGALIIGIFCFFTTRLMRRLHKAQQQIEQLAITDELTGVANRRYFLQRYEEEIDRARRYNSNLSVIMLDIDHFKDVNDTFGHPVGDIVLKEVARLLSANIRTSDLIARYGGEEFVILIPSMNMEEAARAAEKLRVVVEVNHIMMEGPDVQVTVSAGVADIESIMDEKGSIKDKLLRNADKALYSAKETGRNRVVKYDGVEQKQHSLL